MGYRASKSAARRIDAALTEVSHRVLHTIGWCIACGTLPRPQRSPDRRQHIHRRLLVQVERVLKINKRTAITVDVIDAARSMLVIGAN